MQGVGAAVGVAADKDGRKDKRYACDARYRYDNSYNTGYGGYGRPEGRYDSRYDGRGDQRYGRGDYDRCDPNAGYDPRSGGDRRGYDAGYGYGQGAGQGYGQGYGQAYGREGYGAGYGRR